MTREREPELARVTPMRLSDLQHFQDGSGVAAAGMQSYMKGEMLAELTDEAIAGMAHHALRMPTPNTLFEMGMVGGAIADRDEMESAVGLRGARYLGGFTMMSRDGRNLDANIAWTRDAALTLSSGSMGGVYLNFSGDETEERVFRSLGATADGAKKQRLIAIKQRYDPENLFHVNHNIDATVASVS